MTQASAADIRARTVEMHQSAAGDVTGSTVHLQQGAVGFVRGATVHVEQGAVGAVAADHAEMSRRLRAPGRGPAGVRSGHRAARLAGHGGGRRLAAGAGSAAAWATLTRGPRRGLHVTLVVANTFQFDSRQLRTARTLAEDGHARAHPGLGGRRAARRGGAAGPASG